MTHESVVYVNSINTNQGKGEVSLVGTCLKLYVIYSSTHHDSRQFNECSLQVKV